MVRDEGILLVRGGEGALVSVGIGRGEKAVGFDDVLFSSSRKEGLHPLQN